MAMDPETVQAHLIHRYSVRAGELMPTNGGLPLEQAVVLASLVIEATSHPDIFNFSGLASLPAISWLRETPYYWFADLLVIFAYGTLKDYNRHKLILPELLPDQLKKMQHITLLTAIEARKMIPIGDLLKELDIASIDALREILDHSSLKLGTSVIVDLQRGLLEVHHAPQIHRSLSSGVSLEVYFQAATVCHMDDGILSNNIVTQVKVPLSRTGSHFCWKVDFTPEGSGTFIQLLGLVSGGHLSLKSWEGLIFPGMFGTSRGKIFLLPGAGPSKKITDANSMKDYASIDHMLGEYTGLRFPHRTKIGTKQIMFPVYSDHLRAHLKGSKPQLAQNSGIRALDQNFITFLECHPSLLSTSARSVLFFHVRRQYKTKDPNDTQTFRSVLRSRMKCSSTVLNIERHWLFKDVFDYATNHQCQYTDTPFDHQRCIRDWETHGREHLSEAERRLFTTEVFTYIVEHYFDNFLPEVLYILVCGPECANMDMKSWLLKLQRSLQGNTLEWNVPTRCESTSGDVSREAGDRSRLASADRVEGAPEVVFKVGSINCSTTLQRSLASADRVERASEVVLRVGAINCSTTLQRCG